MSAKRLIQKLLRSVHCRFFLRPLPDKVGVYFHLVEAEDHPAFCAALETFIDLGYRFVSPEHFLQSPGKVAYLSFDDNHQEWVQLLPFLEKLGIPAAFFINTCVLRGECSQEQLRDFHRAIDYNGPSQPLSRAEIRQLAEAGHTIGVHTHSHANLATLSREMIREELQTNQSLLQDITGSAVRHMAFTYGLPRFFPPHAEQVAEEMGFATVSWATPGMQFAQGESGRLHRTAWNFNLSREENLLNFRVDARTFVKWTGRSPIG